MVHRKIMVVDDEPDVVTFIKRTLETEGYEVVSAYDGISALDLAEMEQPDLILLDIMMPMMSGYEVCEQLKINPQTQGIPVVCISSAHAQDAWTKTQAVGAVTLLVKPFSPAELLAQLKFYLPDAKERV
ncbi:MAG: hypothetical protein AMXMBFR84_18520 [Candidatus Hydrogenedentota bacterium]